MAPNGDAISLTSTINSYFGSKVRTTSGIVLNDIMDDFSTPGQTNGFGLPPSPANFIKPGKQAMSSMTPTIIVNEHDDVELVVGGAGGSKITTMVAWVIIQNYVFGENVVNSVETPRIHHQLAPMILNYEQGFDAEMIRRLKLIGHVVEELPNDDGFAAVDIVRKVDDIYVPYTDSRRIGSVSYID